MENLIPNPTLAEGDLLELSPMKLPNSILKQKDDLILLQTPVHKHLKVSFITPKRTPAQASIRHPLGSLSTNVLQGNVGVIGSLNSGVSNIPKMGTLTPNSEDNTNRKMPVLKKTMIPRRPGLSSNDMSKTESVPENNIPRKSGKISTDNKWEDLRKLDENLRWRERVEVITKLDHKEYTQCANEYIGEMIDKAVDTSNQKRSKVMTPLPSIMTPITKIMTPISRVASKNFDIISPIAKSAPTNSNFMMPGLEIMTPITKVMTSISNLDTSTAELCTTFDVSTNGSFIVVKPSDNLMQNESTSQKDNILDQNSIAKKSDKPITIKPVSGLKKPTTVRPNQMTKNRSQSVSDNVIGQNDTKHEFKMGSRLYSFDLDNIPENFDPYAPSKTSNKGVNPVIDALEETHGLTNSKVNTTVDVSANGSVFEMSGQAPSFALRPIDSAFGDSEFMDGSKLLEHGHLDLDFLEQITSGIISADLRKQSLYMKFDPLLEGLSSRQSLLLLGRKSDIIDFTGRVTPVPQAIAEEGIVSPREPDLLCDSPSHISAENVTIDSSYIQRGSAGDSVGSASPCLQNSVCFKLDDGIIEVLKYSEDDIQRVLKRKREKWNKERAQSEARCIEFKNTFQIDEVVAKDLEAGCAEAQNKASEIDEKHLKDMTSLKEEKQRIDAESLNITSKSSVLLQRTETLQKISTSLQTNEQKQKEHAKGFRLKYADSRRKVIELEKESTENMKKILSEKSAIETNHSAQMSNIQAKLRATDLRMKSLQAELNRKKNENKELLQICDELLANSEAR